MRVLGHGRADFANRRWKCKNIPALVMTSSDSSVDRSRAAEFGATYFRKPGSHEAFLKLGVVLKELLKDS
jgi:DNA-binding response OmpR family regulator